MDTNGASRRQVLIGALGLAIASAVGAEALAVAGPSVGGVSAIPELAPQWKKLDLGEILSRPAAYVSISHEPLGSPGACR
jgi:hypothetical protein